jgi:hypothetical protein
MGSAVAALLCGVFGLGVFALSGVPSGAATSATLFVDNVNGTETTGCTSSGASACKTIQDGVAAAQLLTNSDVTLNVAGSATNYTESVTATMPSTDTLTIQGTGSTQPVLNSGGLGSDLTIATGTAPVTINNFTISGGSAANGGGINDRGTGTLTLNNDTVTNNTATATAAGISVAGCPTGPTTGTLVANNTTFSSNSGTNITGGVIDAADCGTSATITITNSTFASNSANGSGSGGQGGAIAQFGGTQTLTNDTFVGNIAEAGEGGAVFDGSGVTSAALNFDTFSANTSALDGGAPFSLSNSILAASNPGPNCGGTITDGGHNVASDATCGLGPNSIQNSTTIGTLTLAANGSTGPQTAAITTSSSAAGIVPTAACTVPTDERGQPRPGVGFTACDAGAYEIQKTTGYDLAGTDGGVFVFPVGMTQGFFGSIPGLGIHINNIKGLVPTNNYNGYNLVGSDGGVFVFPLGMPAGFYGSLPGLHVSVNNVVGLVGTNNNHGYNLVGSDGGVFVFPTGQSAGFYGSLPGLGVHTNNIIGIVEQPDGGGYLLVGRDGGVFAFGDAKYLGSLPGSGITVNNIVGIATTLDGKGYYLVGSDGSVYPFGDAVNHGSLPALHVSVNNITSIVPTADGGGYWLIGTDGGVFAFGDAGFIGSLPGLKVTPVSPIIGAVQTLNAP